MHQKYEHNTGVWKAMSYLTHKKWCEIKAWLKITRTNTNAFILKWLICFSVIFLIWPQKSFLGITGSGLDLSALQQLIGGWKHTTHFYKNEQLLCVEQQ